MATKLKVVEDAADIVPAPQIPDFDVAPTRKRHAGWTAERQRKFIEHLALTGNVGEACAARRCRLQLRLSPAQQGRRGKLRPRLGCGAPPVPDAPRRHRPRPRDQRPASSVTTGTASW